MTIGDLVRRKNRDEEPEPVPLLNDPADLCECGICGCNSPLVEPSRFRNA